MLNGITHTTPRTTIKTKHLVKYENINIEMYQKHEYIKTRFKNVFNYALKSYTPHTPRLKLMVIL